VFHDLFLVIADKFGMSKVFTVGSDRVGGGFDGRSWGKLAELGVQRVVR
jgi:hypothetical protein